MYWSQEMCLTKVWTKAVHIMKQYVSEGNTEIKYIIYCFILYQLAFVAIRALSINASILWI